MVWASQVALVVKKFAYQCKKYTGGFDPWVGKILWIKSVDQEDPLEKEMETHSSTLVWKIPWVEEPCGLHSPWGRNNQT